MMSFGLTSLVKARLPDRSGSRAAGDAGGAGAGKRVGEWKVCGGVRGRACTLVDTHREVSTLGLRHFIWETFQHGYSGTDNSQATFVYAG